jgi:hypothetical protein
MKNVDALLAASCALTAVACESSGSGHAISGSSSEGGVESGVIEDSGGDSDSGDDSGGGSSDSGSRFLLGACASAADCTDGGSGTICCLSSSFRAVCQRRPCPFASFGSYQLCDSSAECTGRGQTSCVPISSGGSSNPAILVCGVPPADASSVEDSGRTPEGAVDAAPSDATTID